MDAAVDLFYSKVLADERIKDFFKSTNMERQRQKQKAFLTVAFGGPNRYTGKNLRVAHKNMHLTEEHFNAVAQCLQGTLEELGVGADEIAQVMAIAGSTKAEVLNL